METKQQLCVRCWEPTLRYDEDANFGKDNDGPYCDACYLKVRVEESRDC